MYSGAVPWGQHKRVSISHMDGGTVDGGTMDGGTMDGKVGWIDGMMDRWMMGRWVDCRQVGGFMVECDGGWMNGWMDEVYECMGSWLE